MISQPRNSRFGFLLLPSFSMIAFSSALEPLRMANYVYERKLYQWRLVSLDGRPVTASNGIELDVDTQLVGSLAVDVLVICGGVDIQRVNPIPYKRHLQQLDRRSIALGAICTGSWLLAACNMLNGYRCTVYWENLPAIREMFPQVQARATLFEIDRRRYTATGGTAPLNMMLWLLRKDLGDQILARVSEEFIYKRQRDFGEKSADKPVSLFGSSFPPKLQKAIRTMDSSLEKPRSLPEIASHVGLSVRQIERLFKCYTGLAPLKYYRGLRLEFAHSLLQQTSMPVAEIALSCGFLSSSHFSRCYRVHFGKSALEQRQKSHSFVY